MPITYQIVTHPIELALEVPSRAETSADQDPPHLHISATLQTVVTLEQQAETPIAPLLPQPPEYITVQQIRVPTDILYQAYTLLLPAERMLVIAGMPHEAGTLRLGAVFDVTDTSGTHLHQAHVHADSQKLGQALRMMDYSGTVLGAWVHSHPGTGSRATLPSHIDTSQHLQWLRHYPATLISIIMVEDGYFRVFGSAIENGHVQLQFEGKGIIQEENHVYRLTRER